MLLMDWDGHVCLEFCGTTFCVLYLYKYLYKGSKKVTIWIDVNRPNVALPLHPKDEMGEYIRGRKLNSMECMWRCLGYHTYPRSEPHVASVNVQMKEYVALFVEEKKVCTMLLYCLRPEALSALKYSELFERFVVRREVPFMCGVVQGVNVCGRDQQRRYFHIDSIDNSFGKPVYLVERD